jgi:hypothetical protein
MMNNIHILQLSNLFMKGSHSEDTGSKFLLLVVFVFLQFFETNSGEIQGGPDSIRQFLIINNQSIQQHTGKWESTFCCR